MGEPTLRGRHILVVEDEYMLADELSAELDEAGAIVLGPAGTLESALAMIKAAPRIDVAVIDVNLGGVLAYPAVDLLIERRVPFLFVTGYDAAAIPDRFANVVRYEKPINLSSVARAVRQFIDT
jgi:DNA-binding NtrC family response regulator